MRIYAVAEPPRPNAVALQAKAEHDATGRLLASAGLARRAYTVAELDAKLRASSASIVDRIAIKRAIERAGLLA